MKRARTFWARGRLQPAVSLLQALILSFGYRSTVFIHENSDL